MKSNQFIRLILVCWCFLSLLGAAPNKNSSPTPHSSHLFISVNDNKLTVQIKDVPLFQVLEELTRKVPIKISLKKSLQGESLTVSFIGLPLNQGIKRILGMLPHIFIYDSSFPAKISQIIVLPSSADTQTAKSQLPAYTDPIYDLKNLEYLALNSPNPDDRISALDDYSYSGDTANVYKLLTVALKDNDFKVRRQSLDLLKDLGEGIPLGPVEGVIFNDKIPAIRMQALELYVERANEKFALKVLTKVSHDSNFEVRELSQELLNDL